MNNYCLNYKATLSVVLLFLTVLHADNLKPIQIANKLFSREDANSFEQYVHGEYNGHPNGYDIDTSYTIKVKELYQDKFKSLVAVNLKSSNSDFDAYLHFEKIGNEWKAVAFRSLALVGIIYEIIAQLERYPWDSIQKMTDKQVKELKLSKDISKEEFDFELNNSRMIVASDSYLIEYFKTNAIAFDELKDLALAALKNDSSSDERAIVLIDENDIRCRKLLLRSVYARGWDVPIGIKFEIGGMVDNTVGFLYSNEKGVFDLLSPNGVIMIISIGNGWYLYKTT